MDGVWHRLRLTTRSTSSADVSRRILPPGFRGNLRFFTSSAARGEVFDRAVKRDCVRRFGQFQDEASHPFRLPLPGLTDSFRP